MKPNVYFYAFASKENLSIPIKVMKGRVTLQTFTYKTNVGFNYIPYDLTMSYAGKTAYEKSLQKIFYLLLLMVKYIYPKDATLLYLRFLTALKKKEHLIYIRKKEFYNRFNKKAQTT